MKIAINCAFFQPKGGGIKEYIYNLVTNLASEDTVNEYVLYVLKDQVEYALANLPLKFRIKAIPFKAASLYEIIKRSLLEYKFWRREEQIEQFDIFHSPFFHSPTFSHARTILTVHDLRFYRFPSIYHFLRYVYLKYAVRKSILSAHHIISISSFTKDEIMEAYKVPANKVTVIHESINRERFSQDAVLPNKALSDKFQNNEYILSVGHLEPRKNFDRLIKAYKKIKGNFPGLKLVIVGKKGHHYADTLKMISGDSDIIYMDFVSHANLLWLYAHAKLFVFPTYYEGFGFPPLEAACLGTISAVSKASCVPEICEDSVYYFNPLNIDSIAESITDALNNRIPLEVMKKKAMLNLERFSWQKNVKETLAVYNRVH